MRQLNYTKKPLLLNRLLEAFYKPSKTFEDLQKYDLATENYQKLLLNPDHSIANHMINVLTGKQQKPHQTITLNSFLTHMLQNLKAH